MGRYCRHAQSKRQVNALGEDLVVHDAFGDGLAKYVASPTDKRAGNARQAVCMKTGAQVDIVLTSPVMQRLGLNQTVVRATFHGHLPEKDDFFTINGLPKKGHNTVKLDELQTGTSLYAHPVSTRVESTIQRGIEVREPAKRPERVAVGTTASSPFATISKSSSGPTKLADITAAGGVPAMTIPTSERLRAAGRLGVSALVFLCLYFGNVHF